MSRTEILSRIRTSLGADVADLERRSAVAARLADPPHHPLPARALRPAPELAAMFKDALCAQGADLVTVASVAEIPGAVLHYLKAHGLPLQIRAGADPYLAALPWEGTPDLSRATGPAQAGDSVGLSRAAAGVAETGTLVLASGPDNPVTLAFVPDTHVVIVEAQTIVGSYEEAVTRLMGALGQLPRTLNLVSAPSRTGDIGGKIVMGAHGPRRLAVILIEEF